MAVGDLLGDIQPETGIFGIRAGGLLHEEFVKDIGQVLALYALAGVAHFDDEKLAVVVLIVAIAGLGMAPMWVSDMINDSVLPIISHILN